MSATRKLLPQGPNNGWRGGGRRARTEAPDARRVRAGRRWFVAAAMCAGLLFSGDAWMQTADGAVDIIRCKSHYNTEKYVELHQRIEKNPRVTSIYNLGIVSLCMGKETEGLAHLQTASDSGHVAATHLLGLYFRLNQSFSRQGMGPTKSQDDLNSAIHYYEIAAQMIEQTRDYPRGSTPDMDDIEYYVNTSYYVFSTIPNLYLYGFSKAIEEIVSSEVKLSYVDTLDVLERMRGAAERCVQRPSLSTLEDKEAELYDVQQFRCGTYLDYARAVLPLEQQRLEVAQGCTVPLGRCPEHQDIVDRIDRNRRMMEEAINSIPAEYLKR